MLKIGIPSSASKVQYYLNQAYINYIADAGFIPFVIFPCHDPKYVTNECDGLLLPGGIDIDPIYYGYDNDSSISADPDKDEQERGLLHAFRQAGKPIFGICRGFQLIVREYLAESSRLEEEGVAEFLEHIGKHQQANEQSLSRESRQHWVDYLPSDLYGDANENVCAMAVNSMHHQCLVVNFGATKDDNKMIVSYDNLNVLAWTSRGLKADEKRPYRVVCEALSIDNWAAPILAVQWHPEELRDTRLIKNFFEAHCGRKHAWVAGNS